MKLHIEKDHFLNQEQKKVKEKIMIELLDVMQNNINDNASILDGQSVVDIIFSCLIMFSREVVFKLLLSQGLGNAIKIMPSFLSNYNKIVSDEVKAKLKHYKEESQKAN